MMGFHKLSGEIRSEIARVLVMVAKNGLKQPSDVDNALEAIEQALVGRYVMAVYSEDEAYYIEGVDEIDARESFGMDAEIEHGLWLPSQ